MELTIRRAMLERKAVAAAAAETERATVTNWPIALGMVLVMKVDAQGEIFSRIVCLDAPSPR
jgi:hypothetical protein